MVDEDLIEWMPGANTAAPLLVLQGTGGTNQEILNFGRRLAPQSPLITIAGRQGSGAERQYFRQTAAGPTDPQQIHNEAAWLGEAVTSICQEHRWDADKLILVGYSNGAAMAAYGARTGVIPGQAAVLFHPLWLPVAHPVSRPGYQVWLSAGQRDLLVSVDTVQRVQTACDQVGATTEMLVTGGSHMLTPQEVLAAQTWITQNT